MFFSVLNIFIMCFLSFFFLFFHDLFKQISNLHMLRHLLRLETIMHILVLSPLYLLNHHFHLSLPYVLPQFTRSLPFLHTVRFRHSQSHLIHSCYCKTKSWMYPISTFYLHKDLIFLLSTTLSSSVFFSFERTKNYCWSVAASGSESYPVALTICC